MVRRWIIRRCVQGAERPRADSERNPKGDGAISERDEDRMTPIHVERVERDGHETFDNADPRRGGRDDEKKIGERETRDDGSC